MYMPPPVTLLLPAMTHAWRLRILMSTAHQLKVLQLVRCWPKFQSTPKPSPSLLFSCCFSLIAPRPHSSALERSWTAATAQAQHFPITNFKFHFFAVLHGKFSKALALTSVWMNFDGQSSSSGPSHTCRKNKEPYLQARIREATAALLTHNRALIEANASPSEWWWWEYLTAAEIWQINVGI